MTRVAGKVIKDSESQHNVIGHKVIRQDGYEKVTGKAKYGDDHKPYGMLYAACRYTDIVAGNIKKLDISKAEKMEGVVKIATYKDVTGFPECGPIRQDYPPIVNDRVCFSGDVLAVVAAETQEQAYLAAEAIEVEYEALTPVTDIEEAIKPECRLVHPQYKTNEVVHYPLEKGDVNKGFAESDHILERTYRNGFQEHAYIEPESIIGEPDSATQGVKIYGSLQNQFITRKYVSLYLGLKMNQIVCTQSTLGGAFGGKDDVMFHMACRVGLMAMLTGRPVKLTNSRENSMKESYKKHPYRTKYKVGFNSDGKLKSMEIDILGDSGAYSSQTFFVNWRSVITATGPYNLEHVKTNIRSVYTNNTYTGAFRAFGSPQVIFAVEQLMDEVAETCGISPLEVRRLNGYRQGDTTASGHKLDKHPVSLMQVIDEAVLKSDYERKVKEYDQLNAESDRFKYGIGMSCSFRGCSMGAEGTDMSSAICNVLPDGSVIGILGVTENGQGLKTTFSQIMAEELGITVKDITIMDPNTSAIADGGPTVASRATLTGGSAALDAARNVKKVMFDLVKDDLQVSDIEETEWKNGLISRKYSKAGVEPLEFAKVAEKGYWAGINLSAYGWFLAPDYGFDEHTNKGAAYFTYVYACHVSDIKVDTHTGKIDIEKVVAAHEVGKVINRIGAEGQIYGGVMTSIGCAVLEDYNIENGIVKSENFDTYLLPTIKDVGEIVPVLVENPDPHGPFGAKGMGEPTAELTGPSISNALKMAVKKREYSQPLTLEQVYLGKNLKKPNRGSEAAVHAAADKKQTFRMNNVSIKNPKDLAEALELLSTGTYELLAGGTDVVVQGRMQTKPLNLINIYGLKELTGITESDTELIIGGGTTFTEINENKTIQKLFPLIPQACNTIGSLQIRNRATLGGNIANSAPCADSIPPFMVYGAMIDLQSVDGKRSVALDEFITWGYENVMTDNELIVAVRVPKPADKTYYTGYFQLGRRNAVNITRMSMTALIALDKNGVVEECRMADGALFGKPLRLSDAEKALIGNKLTDEVIEASAAPMEAEIEKAIGGRWSAEYKQPVFMNMYRDVLKEVQEKIQA